MLKLSSAQRTEIDGVIAPSAQMRAARKKPTAIVAGRGCRLTRRSSRGSRSAGLCLMIGFGSSANRSLLGRQSAGSNFEWPGVAALTCH
jgi:hypothetical protein